MAAAASIKDHYRYTYDPATGNRTLRENVLAETVETFDYGFGREASYAQPLKTMKTSVPCPRPVAWPTTAMVRSVSPVPVMVSGVARTVRYVYASLTGDGEIIAGSRASRIPTPGPRLA